MPSLTPIFRIASQYHVQAVQPISEINVIRCCNSNSTVMRDLLISLIRNVSKQLARSRLGFAGARITFGSLGSSIISCILASNHSSFLRVWRLLSIASIRKRFSFQGNRMRSHTWGLLARSVPRGLPPFPSTIHDSTIARVRVQARSGFCYITLRALVSMDNVVRGASGSTASICPLFLFRRWPEDFVS